MSIKSGWIPWNERNDLEDYVLAGFVLDSNREVIRPYLLMVGKIPADKDEAILNEIQKSIIKPGHEDRMEFYLSPFSRLSESLQRGVFNPMFEFPKEYQTIFKGIVSSYENKEKFDYDSSVLQSAPVAAAPADITSIRPYPQIFAQGDEAASTFDNSGAAGMIVAGNTARAVDRLASIENLLASINAKMPGKITRIEDIPPLDLGNPNWKTAKEYAKIKGLSVEALRSNRSSGDKSDDGKAGIHNGHAWRSVGEGSKTRVYYYLY